MSNDIDQRMADLLADHQRMGARPTTEPTGDTHTSGYPLTEKAAGSSLPKSITSGAKKVSRKK